MPSHVGDQVGQWLEEVVVEKGWFVEEEEEL